MTKKILMGVSVLAVLAAFPAFAADTAKDKADTAGAKIEATAEKAADKTKETYNEAKEATKEGYAKAEAKTKEAYQDVKTYFNEDKDDDATVNIISRVTADELIGKKVQNAKGEDIGRIKDILVTADGDAETVVIDDNGLGLGGKLAAFDFDVIEGLSNDKDVVVKLSEANINAASRFEYEGEAKAGEKIRFKPADQYSVNKIIDANVVDPEGKKVADVDTLAFEDDDADYLIVTFNKILGVGGDKAALNLEALDLVEKDGKITFQLNTQQTAQFENYKEGTKAN